MSQVSIVRIEADAPNLSVLRQAVVEAAVGVYGAKVTYAYGLNMTFGVSLGWDEVTDSDGNVVDLQPEVSGWFDQEHKAMSPEVAAEKTAFYDALKKAEHSNPSKVWADVRAYGRRHALEQAEHLCKAEIDLHGIEMPDGAERPDPLATPSKGANDVRSIRLRMIEDLVGLYKAAKREKSLATNEATALVHITSALISMGVDLTSLAK